MGFGAVLFEISLEQNLTQTDRQTDIMATLAHECELKIRPLALLTGLELDMHIFNEVHDVAS